MGPRFHHPLGLLLIAGALVSAPVRATESLPLPEPKIPQAPLCPDELMSSRAAPGTGPKPEFLTLPNSPTRPPQLASHANIRAFGCERRFRLGDETYALDSYHRSDAENLRPFLSGVPAALDYLDAYQRNQRSQRVAAYLGTLGFATALAGFFLVDETKNANLRRTLLFGGLALAGGTFGYSLTVSQTNEGNVRKAIDAYNSAKPGKKITLLLETGLTF
ncbi:MAG: hypothetical protein IT285_14470 [Bdellovibrionales bacterium]|nr:hypothetical protein [Bdellovibrionales bacterium]